MATNWQKNTNKNYKIRYHPLYREPSMVLEPVINEYKRKEMDFNVCDFSI